MAKENYYSLKTLGGENYLAKIVGSEKFIDLEKEEKLDVIKNFKVTPERQWITLTNVFVLVPNPQRQSQADPAFLPVEFSKMPMGSNRVIIQTKHLAEVNVLDAESKFVAALESIKSGMIISENKDILKSSRGLELKKKA